jgi:diacylglycerol O-acyltransferase
MAPVDAVWFRLDEGRSPADIVALLRFGPGFSVPILIDRLRTRLASQPRFRARVEEGTLGLTQPRWVPEEPFLVEAHVRVLRLDDPPEGLDDAARREAHEATLQRELQSLVNQRLDFTRSPWRVWVLENAPEGTAVVVQIHHCMGDGYSLLDLLLSLTDEVDPDPPSERESGGAAATHVVDRPEPSPPTTWLDQLGGLTQLAKDARDTATALTHLLAMPFDPPTPLHGEPGGVRRVAWSKSLELDRVRAAAHVHGGTINDFLLGALAGAFRRYVLDHGGDAKPIRAMVPVNLRPRGAPIDQAHANYFALVFTELPIDEADRFLRVRRVHDEMQRIKHSKEALVAFAILEVLGHSPSMVENVVDDLFVRKATAVVTNVPGPKTKLRLGGTELRDLVFWVPHPCGLAVGASILSYAGTVRVGLRTDTAVVPDPETLARYFEDDLTALMV